jgi:hypothetical protein
MKLIHITHKRIYVLICINVVVAVFLAGYFFLIPSVQLFFRVHDSAWANGQIPSFLYDWHETLSEKYADWARQRVAQGKASTLTTEDVSVTEWPVFGSVFYLWATESLQQAWQQDNNLYPSAPKEYAAEAIEAAVELITDPGHAAWVKQHWGEDYLKKENLFYRMLLIHGMTSYQNLTGNARFQPFLFEQVESLASELDASPYGLLDDYPGQCYPVDIIPAIAAIQRADRILGTDHSAFVDRSLRGFEAERLDSNTGLPCYNVDADTGRGMGSARGVGISFMLIWAPELWPQTAKRWYDLYEKHFWKQNRLLAGFREFPYSSTMSDWFIEVDAGPVAAGYGIAASAFGVGAARANGRFDHACPLSALAIAAGWPLPDGTLLAPRMLSDLSEAPYLGEAALLFSLTRRSVIPAAETKAKQKVPWAVYLWMLFLLTVGIGIVWSGLRKIRRILRQVSIRAGEEPQNKKPVAYLYVSRSNVQFFCWCLCLTAAVFLLIMKEYKWGFLFLLAGQLIPRYKKKIGGKPESPLCKEGD